MISHYLYNKLLHIIYRSNCYLLGISKSVIKFLKDLNLLGINALLLFFGEAIARSKRSPEELFVLLDMYEIMREILPEV